MKNLAAGNEGGKSSHCVKTELRPGRELEREFLDGNIIVIVMMIKMVRVWMMIDRSILNICIFPPVGSPRLLRQRQRREWPRRGQR